MRKVLMMLCVLSLLVSPAYADFVALERGLTAGRIIHSVTNSAYLAGNGNPITESAIAGLSASDYGKTGLTADGNTRLILRYQSTTAGTVAFSVSPSIPGSRLERLTDRSTITGAISTVSTGNTNQASAVFVAPETWPETITYPKGTFTVTATFTPTSGSPTTETLTLTLQAAPVVLVHGIFGTNERAFGYTQGTKKGVWQKLKDAGLTIATWNYANEKSPTELISNNNNGLAKTLADTFDSLNAEGIASTKADLVTHSTGGLLARQYLRSDIDTGNKTANSYGLGTVRRVVTIASPNLGSPVASYIAGKFTTLPSSWQNWAAKTTWEDTVYSLLRSLVFNRKNVDAAMEAFSLSSTYLANLGYPNVPFHSIYGKVASDQDKFNELVDDIANHNVANLETITWLPEEIVNMILAADLDMISSVMQSLSPLLRIKELLGALFGDDDHDLIVSETSAKDIFPSNAVTSFSGMGTHNHILIGQQDDVGEKVVSLLRGGTANFMTNTASATAYDSAFASLIEDYDVSRFKRADDLSQYVDESLVLNIEEPVSDIGGDAGDDYPVYQSVNISGTSNKDFTNKLIVRVTGTEGASKFFLLDAVGGKSFDIQIWAGSANKGVLGVTYATLQDGKIALSGTKTVTFAPQINGLITDLTAQSSTVYCHVGESTPLGVVAHTAEGNYDVSASALKILSYSVADPSVASITDDGKVTGLKVGTTTITATAGNYSVTMGIQVMDSSPAVDATRDIAPVSSGTSGVSSASGGGCSAGFGAVMLLSLVALVRKSR